MYQLEKYTGRNSRYTCPNCGKPHEFSRYIDNDTREYIADHVGICNRVNKCGYHFTPKQYFDENGISLKAENKNVSIRSKNDETHSTHSYKLVEDSRNIDFLLNCNFILFLNDSFPSDTVEDLIDLYKLGATDDGDVIFWQLDHEFNVRAGKIMFYFRDGHRKKYINWAHAKFQIKDFKLKQCLFGEHLLSDYPKKKICIVESEKTAIICQALFPDMIWIASGGINGLNPEKIKVLKDRDVVLWPDIGAYDKWNAIATKYGFGISDYLERNASQDEKEHGLDLADFLLKEKTDDSF